MGCDIHFYVEVRRGNMWRPADRWVLKSNNHRPEVYGKYRLCIPYEELFYTGRNYILFAMLANVRNEVEDNLVIPIDDPRGLPDDACPEILDEVTVDHHSHSYLYLHELLDAKNIYKSIMRESGFNRTVDRMKALSDSDAEYDDVRCVFWFDN